MSNRYGPRIVTDGLICYLDSRDSNSYPGTGSLWYDLTGNGYTFNTGGGTYSNGCLNYNGAYTYAYENVTNSVPEPTTYNDWTMQAFCKPTTLQDLASNCVGSYNMTFFSNAASSSNKYVGYFVNLNTSGSTIRCSFSVSLGASSTGRAITATYPKSANEKVLITARYSYDPGSNTPSTYLYVDGNLLVSGSWSNFGDLISTQEQFRIAGRQNHCTNGSFIGEFYSFKYYNRGLSLSEIQQNALAAGAH